MALVISKPCTTTTIAPTSSLTAALVEFEATLDRDQKTQYRATQIKPNASSVIAFVGRLDEAARGKNRTGVSSRMVTFLDALQQFTDVIETFVSSNPTIAALVWGGVKTTILAASNISSFFGKVTSMIMEIGKFCPAYSCFGHLYPDNPELQSALCEYYASVIRICTKVIEVLRRSAVSHALSSIISPFDSEFSDHIAHLREGAELIKLQITYAANKATLQAEKLAAEERKLNKKLRLNIRKERTETQEWRLQQSRREISQLRDAIRDKLSTLESLKAYKRVLQQRVPGTAGWILKDNAFCQWRSDREGAVLWCSGKMGSGKTVLMSSMVEHLHVLRQPTELIAHHFCFSDEHASLETRNIMGSIARQLLEGWLQDASTDQLRALHREVLGATSGDITPIINNRLLADKSYYIMLDGIDECEIGEARNLVKSLSELSRKHRNIRIALSSRLEMDKILRQKLVIKHHIQGLEIRTRADMRCYIDAILDQRLEDKELVLHQPSIILKISDKLEQESEGMFLWVRLFIDDLCEQQSDNDILAGLQGPPPSISRLIDRKMTRIQQRPSSKNVLKLLQFCGVLKRPLTVLEFDELLSLNTDQVSRDAGQMVRDVHEIVADAGGLTYVDEEEQTVHYVHQSVRNHLFDSISMHDRFAAANLDLHLGFLVLTYLNFSDFQRSLAKVDTRSSLSFRPVDMVVTSFADSGTYAARAAQKLLRSRTSFKQLEGKELERRIRETVGTANQPYDQLEIQYPFLAYAKSFWLDHLEQIDSESDKRMWSLFRKLVEGESGLIDTPWTHGLKVHPSTYPSHEDTARAVDWALAKQKSALVMYELVQNMGLVKESDQRRILNSATPSTLSPIMSVLICQQKPGPDVIYTAFARSASLGLTGCVDMCIRQGFDPTPRPDRFSRTPLEIAAGGGHLELVERLIDANADVNAAAAAGGGGRTALQAAAGGGHLEVVERLLAAKADVNAAAAATAYNGRTALQAAAGGGHLEVVERLIVAKADVNAAAAATAYNGRTALQAAAGGGHLEVVKRLIAAKADINAAADTGGGGRTALQAAAGGGHLEVVERLLAAKADVNAVAAEYDGRTALQAAAEGGHFEVVERLIVAKADVNAVAAEFDGRTALQAAAEGGHLEVVERLIAAKADVNGAAVTDVGRRTALQEATMNGHLDIVKRLKDAGARK